MHYTNKLLPRYFIIKLGCKYGHYVGGIERKGLCSIMAVCTALLEKDYKKQLCEIENDTEREGSVIFDYLADDVTISKVRSTIEYSQNTSIALKISISSVMNRQIGYLKGSKKSIRKDKVKYLAPEKQPSKSIFSAIDVF